MTQQAWPWRRLPGEQPKPSVLYSLAAEHVTWGPGNQERLVAISKGTPIFCTEYLLQYQQVNDCSFRKNQITKQWSSMGVAGT